MCKLPVHAPSDDSLPGSDIGADTYLLVDYDNLRQDFEVPQPYKLVPKLPEWAERFVKQFGTSCRLRFYHGWIKADLSPSDALEAFEHVRRDGKTASALYDLRRSTNTVTPVEFEAARFLVGDPKKSVLPTSRKHTIADCRLNECPRHQRPAQKVVDTMLVTDAQALRKHGHDVFIVSRDDDMAAAFLDVSGFVVPDSFAPPPALSQALRSGAQLIRFDYPYSLDAWQPALPSGHRR